MSQDEMPGGGLMLDGPPSALAVMKGIVARGLTPVTDHEYWVRTNEALKGTDLCMRWRSLLVLWRPSQPKTRSTSRTVVDCELLMRRWQLIREAHRLNPKFA